ncbi:PEP-CTERM sorting domain-containing protein [Oxalobacteraceae bacterium]|nr:PEP-CTERM sorting domain-containing protein [Oxalobacteraceae bacterium]
MKPMPPMTPLLLATLLSCALPAHAATTVYATYTGSQLGVTERTESLSQTLSFATGVSASGIALGVSNDLYIAAGNQLINYGTNGTLINTMTFPDPSINYTDVDVGGGHVVASYNGSQQGFTVRDYALNQSNAVGTGFNISGIAAGINDHVYLASGNHLYDYLSNGTQVFNMTFPDAGINYTDIDYGNNMLVASYTGAQQGVTLRDLALNQNSSFSVGFNIDSLALGNNNDVFLTSGNHIYNYTLGGVQITDMTFPDSAIQYTGIAVTTPVPEPESIAMLLAGLGMLAWRSRRRAA